jgi:hypothetical protein
MMVEKMVERWDMH